MSTVGRIPTVDERIAKAVEHEMSSLKSECLTMANLKIEPVPPLTDAERAAIDKAVDDLDVISDALFEKTRNAVRIAREKIRAVLSRLEKIECGDDEP